MLAESPREYYKKALEERPLQKIHKIIVTCAYKTKAFDVTRDKSQTVTRELCGKASVIRKFMNRVKRDLPSEIYVTGECFLPSHENLRISRNILNWWRDLKFSFYIHYA